MKLYIGDKIIEYKNVKDIPSKLQDSGSTEEKIIICASNVGAIGMNVMMKDYNNMTIISIGQIIKSMVGSWDSEKTKLIQELKLGKVILDLISETKLTKVLTHSQEEILENIFKIKDELLASIRLMVEANLKPSDLSGICDDDEFIVFLKVWEKVEQIEDSFSEYRETVINEFNDKDRLASSFKRGLEEAIKSQIRQLKNFKKRYGHNKLAKNIDNKERELGEVIDEIIKRYEEKYKIKEKDIWEKIGTKNRKTTEYILGESIVLPSEIVLHGFYFLTPIQHYILYKLKNIGKIDNIFLNNSYIFDKVDNSIFEIWNKSFSPIFCNITEDEIIQDYEPLQETWGLIFSDINNGETKKKIESDLEKLHKKNYRINKNNYSSIISMVNDIDKSNQNEAYFSPYKKEINSLLKDITEKNVMSNLLETPIGEFINVIHEIWKKSIQQGETYIDIELLNKCFSTGWLEIEYGNEKKNAADYLYILKDLESYFKNCKTISQWHSYMNTLKNAKEYLGKILGLNNIICNFSYFNVKDNDIKIINKFVLIIDEIIKVLNTSKSESINVNTHFELLESIINEYSKSTKGTIENDEDLEMLRIVEKILESDLKTTTCLSEDVFKALSTYVENKLMTADEEKYDDIILDMDGAEFTQILGFSKANLCQIDNNFIPGGKTNFTWPLSEPLINKMMSWCGNNKDDSEILLQRLLLIIKEKKLSNKYLYYKMLESCRDISLVRIDNLIEEEFDESFYNKLIIDYCSNDKNEETNKEKYEFSVNDIVNVNYKSNVNLNDIIDDNIPRINEIINQYKLDINYMKQMKGISKAYQESLREEVSKGGNKDSCLENYFKTNGDLIQANRIFNKCKRRFWIYYINKDKFISYRDDFHQKFLFSLLIHIINQKLYTHPELKNDKRMQCKWKNINKIEKSIDISKIESNFNIILTMINNYFPQWTDIEKISQKNDAIKYFYANLFYIKELEISKCEKLPIIIGPLKENNENGDKENKAIRKIIDITYNEDEYLKKFDIYNSMWSTSKLDTEKGCKYCNAKDDCWEFEI